MLAREESLLRVLPDLGFRNPIPYFDVLNTVPRWDNFTHVSYTQVPQSLCSRLTLVSRQFSVEVIL